MSTLYRKYRPQNFAEVFGQNHIKLVLQHELISSQLAHAYLFCGPRAVGKTTLARVLAKAVNCLNRQPDQFEPCGICQSCIDITAGRAMDIIEIDAASHTGVDNVRENIIAGSRVSPSLSKRKVFIIDEVHMLSTQAFNALLKTLEEPPEYMLFILCTTEAHKVPATIISRCQRFDFKRIGLSDMVRKLSHIVGREGVKVSKEILESVARHSDGHMRDAESLLGQLVNLGDKEITQADADLVIPRNDLAEVITFIELLANKDAANGVRLVNRLLDDGVDLRIFVSDAVEILRKLMLLKINQELADWLTRELGTNLELRMSQLADQLSLEQINAYIDQLMKTSQELKSSFIIQLPLELAIVKLTLLRAVEKNTPTAAMPINVTQQSAQTFSTPSTVPPVTLSADGSVDINQLMSRWEEFLVRVKQQNHSLSVILRICQPKSVNGSEVCLAFKYKFHKDRIADPAVKGLIERVLRETFNTSLTVEAVIDENLNTEMPPTGTVPPPTNEQLPLSNQPVDNNEQLIDNLLKTFGGKVVS